LRRFSWAALSYPLSLAFQIGTHKLQAEAAVINPELLILVLRGKFLWLYCFRLLLRWRAAGDMVSFYHLETQLLIKAAKMPARVQLVVWLSTTIVGIVTEAQVSLIALPLIGDFTIMNMCRNLLGVSLAA
jgi:hypothetical protein